MTTLLQAIIYSKVSYYLYIQGLHHNLSNNVRTGSYIMLKRKIIVYRVHCIVEDKTEGMHYHS